MFGRWGCCLAMAGLAVGCGGGDAPARDAAAPDAARPAPDAAVSSTAPVFEPPLPGAGADWGALPYPSDLYLDADGYVALTSIPIGPNADPTFAANYLGWTHSLRGAGVWSNVYFPIDGEVDEATLAGNARLVDLDGGLAELPATLVWRSDLGMLVVAPDLGVVLRQAHRYAAYVTDGVRGADGGRLAAPPAFAAAIDLAVVPGDPAVAAAQRNLRPLIEALPGDTAAGLVAATVFTTADDTGDLAALRDAATAVPPVVSDVSVWPDLDGVFGVQDPAAPPGFSIFGPRAQPHGKVAAVLHGTIALTSYVTDTPGEAGIIELDGAGAPIAKGTEDVRFTLVLPAAASYASQPLMLFQHGLGRSRVDVLTAADVAAAHGIAVLAIDTIHHGDRLYPRVDQRNAMTGAATPDGFGDADNLKSTTYFIHGRSSGGLAPLDPRVISSNSRQTAADLMGLVAYARSGDTGPINAALAGAGLPSDLSFHPAGVAVAAESLGSTVAGIAAAAEPGVGIVSLSAPPGGAPFPSMIHSPKFQVINGLWFEPLDVDGRIALDLASPMDARFDPIAMLWTNMLQPGDLLTYAACLASGAVRGDSGPHIQLIEAYDDEWVHNEGTEWLAGGIGIPRMPMALAEPPPEPALRYVSVPELAAPVAGNAPGGRTRALNVFHPAQHGLTTFYEDLKDYEPGFPPTVKLAEPLPVGGFTVPSQTMRAQFFADFFAGEVPVLRDPFAK